MRTSGAFLMLVFLHAAMVLQQATTMADTIWLKDNDIPLHGIVESVNADSVVFRQTADGVQYEKVVLPKADIETIVTNFDSLRLSRLSPENLLEYAEYAEELLSQKNDPVARSLAIRLLVVVIGNSNDSKLRRSSLSQLVSLARGEVELEKFQKLYHLETGIQISTIRESQTDFPITTENRDNAIELIKRVRQGKPISEQADNVQLKETVNAFESICSWDELLQISKSNRINNQQLRRLVALESRLRKYGVKDGIATVVPEEPWNLLAKRIGIKDVYIPRIETVTEFSPNDALFVDGKWLPIGR